MGEKKCYVSLFVVLPSAPVLERRRPRRSSPERERERVICCFAECSTVAHDWSIKIATRSLFHYIEVRFDYRKELPCHAKLMASNQISLEISTARFTGNSQAWSNRSFIFRLEHYCIAYPSIDSSERKILSKKKEFQWSNSRTARYKSRQDERGESDNWHWSHNDRRRDTATTLTSQKRLKIPQHREKWGEWENRRQYCRILEIFLWHFTCDSKSKRQRHWSKKKSWVKRAEKIAF